MANDLTANPVFIDTTVGASLARRDGGYKITSIVWDDPSTAGHQLIIDQGSSTDIIFQATAQADNAYVVKEFNPAKFVPAIRVATMGSGRCLIYLKPQYSNPS